MKKNLKNFFWILLGVFAGIVLLLIGKAEITDHLERIVLNIDGKNYNLLIARTSAEKMRGLSGFHDPSELKGADGMIFYFSPAQFIAFWNKDTHLDLNLIWMRDGKTIGRDFLPSEDRAGLVVKNSPGEVDWVIELTK